MKNILQLFKKMQPKRYYDGEGVAVVKGLDAPACNASVYTVETRADMSVQDIGLIKAKNIR